MLVASDSLKFGLVLGGGHEGWIDNNGCWLLIDIKDKGGSIPNLYSS